MTTPKEYEIYLKVNKFIESENCDEVDIIPQLIIPAYVPLIIESDDMEPTITLYQLLLEDVGSLNKQWFMPIGIGVRE